MGVTTDSNISANNNDNHPSIIGNTSESNLKNSSEPVALSPPSDSQATAATSSRVGFFSWFFGDGRNQKTQQEILGDLTTKNIQTFTLVGGIILLLLSTSEMLEKHFSMALFCLLHGGVLIVCCLLGNERQDWRFILAVFVTALMLSVFAASGCILAAIRTFYTFHLNDSELAELGFDGRGQVVAFGALHFIFSIFYSLYWSLVTYFNRKIILLMRMKSSPSNQQQSGSNEATADATVVDKDVGIGRDLTRAGTFVELV